MSLATRTKLASILRAYNMGILDAHEFYHAVANLTMGE